MILTLFDRQTNAIEQEVWIYNNAKEWNWKFDDWVDKDGVSHYISGVYLSEDDAIAFRLRFGK